MRPKKLRIMGLNSFTEEQIIDFGKLTEKGLFGIFGPTGSGKSTILDAITIAMYGKISRGTGEFINTETGQLHISYEFNLGPKASRRTYVVERHMKRDASTGRYKTGSAILREIKGQVTEVLCDKTRDVDGRIIEIVGLNCEDFTRSVVLPQGKFSEFLKLTGSHRRNMLERIFRLEKFGSRMTDRIKGVRKGKKSISDNLDGQLKRYEGITKEEYDRRKEQLNLLILEEERLKARRKSLEEEYEKYKLIWQLQEELDGYKKSFEGLNLKKQEIDEKREKLERAIKALGVKPFIDSEEETRKKILKSVGEIASLEARLKEASLNLKETEDKYNAAYERKDKELPALIEKEARLKTAIELDKEIKSLEKEREDLIKQYRDKDRQISQVTEEFEKLLKVRQAALDSIEESETRIKEIGTDPIYREKVAKGGEVEKEYIELGKKIDEKAKKVEALKAQLEIMEKEYEEISHKRKGKEAFIASLEAQKKSINENCPGDNTSLLNMKDILQDMEKRLSEAKDDYKKREELEKFYKTLDERKKELSLKLKDIRDRIDDKKCDLDNVLKEIEKIEKANMANILAEGVVDGEPCPVCGSIHHPNLAGKTEDSMLKEKIESRDCLRAELDVMQKDANKLEVDYAGVSREAQIKEDELKTLSKALENLDINALESEKSTREGEFKSLRESIEKWEKEKSDIDNQLSDGVKEKGRIDTREAGLGEGLKKDGISLEENKQELSLLNEKLHEVSIQYARYKEEIGVDDVGSELDRLNKNAREEDSLRKKVMELRGLVNGYDAERASLETKLNSLNLEKARIEEIGKEKGGVIKDRRASRDSMSEGKDPFAYIAEVRKLQEEIKQAENSLKKLLDERRNEMEKQAKLKSNEEKNLETLKGLLEEQHKKLIDTLDETGFEDSEEAIKSLMDKKDRDALEKEIKHYDETVNLLINNTERVEKRLGDNHIDKEKWQSIIEDREKNVSLLEDKTKIIAGEQKELTNMKKDLEEVKKLNKEKKEIDHVLDLLDDLEKLIQGNRFVEFASMNQLKYISVEASRRLREITNGRYALELDSSGEFVMRDDYNGGARRAVDTLSGGETFLTSLCLAIALSSHIQLKGSAPLEFFFLDEGFGTLDSQLLETVMTSLEKLQSDRLSVGIISHVEELKNRVPVKLMVSPAKPGAGGTKVKMEYS